MIQQIGNTMIQQIGNTILRRYLGIPRMGPLPSVAARIPTALLRALSSQAFIKQEALPPLVPIFSSRQPGFNLLPLLAALFVGATTREDSYCTPSLQLRVLNDTILSLSQQMAATQKKINDAKRAVSSSYNHGCLSFAEERQLKNCNELAKELASAEEVFRQFAPMQNAQMNGNMKKEVDKKRGNLNRCNTDSFMIKVKLANCRAKNAENAERTQELANIPALQQEVKRLNGLLNQQLRAYSTLELSLNPVTVKLFKRPQVEAAVNAVLADLGIIFGITLASIGSASTNAWYAKLTFALAIAGMLLDADVIGESSTSIQKLRQIINDHIISNSLHLNGEILRNQIQIMLDTLTAGKKPVS